jgi:hypothetical protein
MSYTALHEPVNHDESAYAAGPVNAKFCSMGFVTSNKWFPGYLTVLDGIVRLYASEQACQLNPQDCVLQIQIKKNHHCSALKIKNYSKDPMKIIDFHCFYIEVDNGIFMPTRELKIGCLDPVVAEDIRRAVHLSTGRGVHKDATL